MSGDNKITNISGLRNILNLANDINNDDNDDNDMSGELPDEQFNINYNDARPAKTPSVLNLNSKLDEVSESHDNEVSKSASVSVVGNPGGPTRLRVKTKPGGDRRPTLPLAPGESSGSGSASASRSGSEEEQSGQDEGSIEERSYSEGSQSASASRSVSVVGTPRKRSKTSRTQASSEEPRKREKPITAEDIMLEKQKIILEFARLEKRGVTFTKHFTLNSDLNEMKFELMKAKKIFQLEKDLKIARNLLWNGTKVITFGSNLLSKYTPIDLELEGWPDEIKSNIYDYDDVLERLIEKYKSKVDAPPEIQLGYMLLSSAIQYSAANKVPKVFAKMMNVRNQEYDPNQSFEKNIGKMEDNARGPAAAVRGPGHDMAAPEDDPEMAEIMREINSEKKKMGK